MTTRTERRPPVLSLPSGDLRPIAFFFLLPFAISVLTATSSGYTQSLGYGRGLLYVGLLSLVPWWITEGTTRIAWRALRRYRPPLWLLSCVGILLACIFVGPYVSAVSSLFKAYWPAGNAPSVIDSAANFGVLDAVVQTVRAAVHWVVANYVFDRLLDYPRFRYANRSKEAQFSGNGTRDVRPIHANGLQARLNRIKTAADILFIKAEEHYVRVHGEREEELVSYTFKSALNDMKKEDGFQVHRSDWVRRHAIASIQDRGACMTLKMIDGSVVPVSRPHHALVRQVL